MRLRLLAAALLVAAALVFGLAVRGPASPHRASRAGLEVVPLNPHALAALKAQGRSLKRGVPTGVNQGRKFNPKGDLVGQLPAAYPMALNVLVLFVDFSDEPPGGPAQRLDLSYFDDMLFGTTYDPPEYATYPAHPTDRTLVNYFEETSFGKVDIVTLNVPSAHRLAAQRQAVLATTAGPTVSTTTASGRIPRTRKASSSTPSRPPTRRAWTSASTPSTAWSRTSSSSTPAPARSGARRTSSGRTAGASTPVGDRPETASRSTG